MQLVMYTNYSPHAAIPAADMKCKETQNHTRCMSKINYYIKTYITNIYILNRYTKYFRLNVSEFSYG